MVVVILVVIVHAAVYDDDESKSPQATHFILKASACMHSGCAAVPDVTCQSHIQFIHQVCIGFRGNHHLPYILRFFPTCAYLAVIVHMTKIL